jgi:hypothetical protein
MSAVAIDNAYGLPNRPLSRSAYSPNHFSLLKQQNAQRRRASYSAISQRHNQQRVNSRRMHRFYFGQTPLERYATDPVVEQEWKFKMPHLGAMTPGRQAKISAQGGVPPKGPKAVTAPVGGKMAGGASARGGMSGLMQSLGFGAPSRPAFNSSFPNNSVNKRKKDIFGEPEPG